MLYPNLNPLYVTSVAIDPPFIDKSTGLPLQGYVQFWRDADRIVPKPVFELTGTAPNYTFAELPNPVSVVNGRFVDTNGTDVAVYYFPWDDQSPPNLDLYFIQVYNSQGVEQCERQAWPYPTLDEEQQGQDSGPTSLSNVILNSEFAFLNFNPQVSNLVLNITSGNNQVFNFAPGWNVLVSATGNGTITINQIQPAGTNNYPGQPPTLLQVVNSGAITFIAIEQVLTGNPNIFAQDDLGFGGFVNTSIMLSPNSAVDVVYVTSSGPNNYPVLLAANNNTSGIYETFSNTVSLPEGQNPTSFPTASTSIQIVLAPNSNNTFSCVQVVPTSVNVPIVAYQQTPLIRQQGELFGIYQPALNYKPTNSYLIGWDFPMNPAQLLGPGTSGSALGPYTTGANTGNYIWDQTILFQSADNSVKSYRDTNGGLTMAATANGQVALLQYLGPDEAREIFNDRASVHISGSTTHAGGLVGTVTLWACTSANLPNVNPGTNQTGVTALNSVGFPTMGNGSTWVQMPNILDNTTFELVAASSTNSESADIYLNGWDFAGSSTANTATFFCIVVGFAPWVTNDTINIKSISCCPGDIATRPLFRSRQETLTDCEHYFETSYQSFAAKGTVTLQNSVMVPMTSTIPSGGNAQFLPVGFSLQYRTAKRIPSSQGFPNLSVYSTKTGTDNLFTAYAEGNVLNTFDTETSGWSFTSGNKYVTAVAQNNGGVGSSFATLNATTPLQCSLSFHYILDSRLGIVN